MQKITTTTQTRTQISIDELILAIKIAMTNEMHKQKIVESISSFEVIDQKPNDPIKKTNKDSFLNSLELTADSFCTENESKYIKKVINRIKSV